MPAAVGESIAFIRAALAADGYAYLPAFASDPTGRALLTCARALGALWPLPDTDAAHPLMETRPAADAPAHAPFDRPEALGWHNDFSTHPERPGVSLAYLDRPDPLGPERGAWRVASCDRVLEHLDATRDGREALRFLVDRELPFSFTGEGAPTFFRVLECRGSLAGRHGVRFYGRALRDGARLAFGLVPDEMERAIRAVETAADAVGRTLAALAGALLVTDNWHSLHDRLPQSVGPDLLPRRSLLCFVEELHEPLSAPATSPAR
jgi:hypothetical protein